MFSINSVANLSFSLTRFEPIVHTSTWVSFYLCWTDFLSSKMLKILSTPIEPPTAGIYFVPMVDVQTKTAVDETRLALKLFSSFSFEQCPYSLIELSRR